ncbi:hypothetical protein TKK_0007685 [Trichogramma kaykai]|uniref:Uncharacterized protein n=1 Tax=Trichogramma kaykai TaxID=54128 RepID=A0ABD2X774_9HYME
MRAVSCLLLLVAVAHLSEASIYDIRADVERYAVTRTMASKLRVFLEALKGYMQTGNDELGIPKMDPFETKFQKIDLKKRDLVLKGNVSEVHVEGLSNYKVGDVDFRIGQKNLTIGLKWPRINGTTKYSVDATYSEKVSIYGTGDVSFDIRDLEFYSQIQFQKSKAVKIVGLIKTRVKLGALKLNLTGLFNDDELSGLVSEALSDVLPETIDEYQAETVALVNELVVEEGNKLVVGSTWTEIISKLG